MAKKEKPGFTEAEKEAIAKKKNKIAAEFEKDLMSNYGDVSKEEAVYFEEEIKTYNDGLQRFLNNPDKIFGKWFKKNYMCIAIVAYAVDKVMEKDKQGDAINTKLVGAVYGNRKLSKELAEVMEVQEKEEKKKAKKKKKK